MEYLTRNAVQLKSRNNLISGLAGTTLDANS